MKIYPVISNGVHCTQLLSFDTTQNGRYPNEIVNSIRESPYERRSRRASYDIIERYDGPR